MGGGEACRQGRAAPLIGLAAWLAIASTIGAGDAPRPGDDATYRPTVMILQGKSVGSGTIIASVEDETLVLTASHVVEGSGPIEVDLFRFNLGLERSRDASGFPRKLFASVVARDLDADLAVLRVRGERSMPYVARLAGGVDAPLGGTPVTTIGFDKGEKLIGFTTRITNVERIDMDRGGGERPFLVTELAPEVGRSGGGLFRADGALVGVCVGRAELEKGRKSGLFSTLGNVKALIRADEELAASITRPRSPTR